MDRGYLDFIRLYRLHQAGGFFVVRNKHHVKFRVLASRPVDKTDGLRCDQTIQLVSPWSRKSYHTAQKNSGLRCGEQVTLVLLTNQFDVAAAVIAELYRKRWQVELFFKWIKQHLRIRSFYGRSENAVRVQIWSAICAYLMVAIVRKQLNLQQSLNEIANCERQHLRANDSGRAACTNARAAEQIVGDRHPQNLLWPNT